MNLPRFIFSVLFLLCATFLTTLFWPESAGTTRSTSAAENDSDASSLRLVPFPKEIKVDRAVSFDISQSLKIVVPKSLVEILGKQIAEEFTRLKLATPKIEAGDDTTLLQILPQNIKSGQENNAVKAILPTPEELKDAAKSPVDPQEGYAIKCDANGLTAIGCGESGLYFAGQTVRQLIRANVNDTNLPALEIRDWPSMRYRCFMDDYTRGPSPHRSEIMRFLEVGSAVKHNMFTYYMEYQFKFKKHPKIGPDNGSIDIEDLKAMVEFGKPRSITILGTQQSFSHSRNTLKHPEYAGMGEAGYILSPVVPKTYEYLDDLYSELCPVLPFEMLNVCCDETWDLGKGPSKELAEKIGVPGVYMMHIQKVHELLKNRGKRMMMWGDIIMQHPEKIPEIPSDMVMLCWDYAPRPDFLDYILPYSKAGFEFFVCPGVSNWSRMLCDHETAVVNIKNFVRDGVENGALGMLNTNWKDDGESLQGYTSYTTIWGGEMAWSGAKTDVHDFNRRIGAVLFGEKGDNFGKAIEEIIEVQKAGYIFNGRFWENDFLPIRDPKVIQKDAQFVLEHIRPAIQHLQACQKEATVNADQLEAYLFGAKRIELIATRMLDGLEAARQYQNAYRLNQDVENDTTVDKDQKVKNQTFQVMFLDRVKKLITDNRAKHAELGEEFARLWNRESKPYALDWTMKRYESVDNWYEKLLQQVEEAITASKDGKPIPAADEIGLGLPEEYRRTTTYKTSDRNFDAVKWHVEDAKLRCGIEIDVKGNNRAGLPIELDFEKLPAEYANQPVRAFVLKNSRDAKSDKPASAVEIPAQLDLPQHDTENNDMPLRLTFVLPVVQAQPISSQPKEADATVLVYFGCSKPSSANMTESDANFGVTSTSQTANGMKWIENNKVKLLLGSEGGHIYRWEIKELGNRDITLEGETSFSGFSDAGGANRSKPYELVLMASGPAMTRYGCFANEVLEKTITLFADSSCCEVKLVNPTGYYWDFDTPKNFSADEGSAGTVLFSDGTNGKVGEHALNSSAVQVAGNNVTWGIKYDESKLALGLVTPESPTNFRVGPGGEMGGVGIESSVPRYHFVTFGGILTDTPENIMNTLQQTYNWKNQPVVKVTPLKKK
ncbi:MAG: glycoside hydrolase family 20 zincin-like fold domain-containing protein [Thermoguttaceae bacterium]